MNDITKINDTNQLTTASDSNDMFEIMGKAYKYAELMAKSDLIPSHYKGKPANVFIAIQTAFRMNIDPMHIMQNTYVIHGKLGMNASFAISLANNSGIFKSGIKYREEGEGKDLSVTAYAVVKKDNEEISYKFGMKQAAAEGYTTRTGNKYLTMPELMLRYRAATLLIRTHIPEVLNGMQTVEELEDVTPDAAPEAPKSNNLTSKLSGALEKYKVSSINNVKDSTISNDYSQASGNSDEEIKTIDDNFTKDSALQKLMGLITKHNVQDDLIKRWCDHANIQSIDELNIEQINKCINHLQTENKHLIE